MKRSHLTDPNCTIYDHGRLRECYQAEQPLDLTFDEDKHQKRKGIQSVEIGIGVLDALVRLGRPSSLTDIARASGQSVSQAHRYLASFVNTGFLRQDPATALYDLHTGALRLGLAAMGRLDTFEEASRAAQELVAASELFLVCGVTGDALPDLQCFERDDWVAYGPI